MDIEEFRRYCLAKQGASETFPFGPDTLVFKVMGKMFALARLEQVPFEVSLKCDPERALDLREEYFDTIKGAYHLNKKHWNAFQPERLPGHLVTELIDHSYDLVVARLTKKEKQQLKRKDPDDQS